MRDSFPATDMTIADVNEANREFYSRDSTPKEREARKAANSAKYPRHPVLNKEQRHQAAVRIQRRINAASGPARAAARAELMDPGPRDETDARAGHRESHEVVVGNIGSVYSGRNRAKAAQHFQEYVSQSKSGVGRAGGESVTHLKSGEIHREHVGSNESSDASYESKERAAIRGEKKSRGSTSFNFGASETQKTRTQRGLATKKLIKTRTPRGYEASERKAIQGPQAGSTAFPFGHNKA